MRKRVIWALVAAYVLVGAASWAMPSRVERIIGPDWLIVTQGLGIPAYWMVAAGLNVLIMGGIIGSFALVGWLISRRKSRSDLIPRPR